MRETPSTRVLQGLVGRNDKDLAAVLIKQMKKGLKKYGHGLMPHNGRDTKQDLIEELLDAACYAQSLHLETGKLEYADLTWEVVQMARDVRLEKPRPDFRVALCVGHSLESQGARNFYGVSEYEFNHSVVTQVVRRLCGVKGIVARMFTRDPSFAAEVAVVNAWAPDLVLDVHFNSLGSKTEPNPPRSEILYCDNRGKYYAEAIETVWAQDGRRVDARLQTKTWDGKDLYLFNAAKAPALILEPFFGNLKAECDKYTLAVVEDLLISAVCAAYAVHKER